MGETVDEIFRRLPERYKPGVVKKTQHFYFSIDDHKYTVTLDPESCTVEEGKTVDNAEVFLKTSADLFLKTYNGEYRPGMSDFMSGRVKSNNPYALKSFIDAFDHDA
jgi:putative sterol carrier protein